MKEIFKYDLHVVFLTMGVNSDWCDTRILKLKDTAKAYGIKLKITISINAQEQNSPALSLFEEYGTAKRRDVFLNSAEEHHLEILYDFQKIPDAKWLLLASEDDIWIDSGLRKLFEVCRNEKNAKVIMFDGIYMSEGGNLAKAPMIHEKVDSKHSNLLDVLARRGYFYGPSKIGIFLYRYDSFSKSDLDYWKSWLTFTIQFTHCLFNLRLSAILGGQAISYATPLVFSKVHKYNFDDDTSVIANWYARHRGIAHQFDWTFGQFFVLQKIVDEGVLTAKDISDFVIVDLIRGTVPLVYDFYWRLMIASRRSLIHPDQRVDDEIVEEMCDFLKSLEFCHEELVRNFRIVLSKKQSTAKIRLRSYKEAQAIFDCFFTTPFRTLLLDEDKDFAYYRYFGKVLALRKDVSVNHFFRYDNLNISSKQFRLDDSIERARDATARLVPDYSFVKVQEYESTIISQILVSNSINPYLNFPRLQILILRNPLLRKIANPLRKSINARLRSVF
jgi:hypothetical protein